MGCGASAQNSLEADNGQRQNNTVGSPILPGNRFVPYNRKKKNKDQKNDPSTVSSKNPSHFGSSSDIEERARARDIGATYNSQLLQNGGTGDKVSHCATAHTPLHKSAHACVTLPPCNPPSALSNAEAVGFREKDRIATLTNPPSVPPLQRQLSRSGRRLFLTSPQLVPTPPLPTQARIRGKRNTISPKNTLIPHVSISLPKSLGDKKASTAGTNESTSGIAALPSQERPHVGVLEVDDGCCDIDSEEDNNTSTGHGMLPPMIVVTGQGSASRAPVAPSGSFSAGLGGGRCGVSPKGAAATCRRSHSTGSLLSFDGTPNNPHAVSSSSDFGREILGGSPVLSGLATGESGSLPQSVRVMPIDRHNPQMHSSHTNGLAIFCNRPRECALCQSAAVAFGCEVCDEFFLCEECRFDPEAVRAIHDPTHAMLSIQDNHCSTSRTFGGDSIFSLSGDGGVSSFFYHPCFRCKRVIDDSETVYRCDQCDYILCQGCLIPPRDPEDAMEREPAMLGEVAPEGEEHASSKSSPREHATLALLSGPVPPHEHELKRFQRKSRSNTVHEGAMFVKARSSDGNKIINDYVVVRQLGHGSYAKVKLVQHIHTRELFALKILRRQKKKSLSGISLGRSRTRAAMAGTSEDDLLREIAVMKFIDHPNVVKLKEVIEDVDSQKVYVIMEYCEKGPVHVADDPPLPLEQVRQCAADILRGLLHLHSEFLYHRDIKPANCLVKRNGVVKIADFGTCNSQIRTKIAEGTLAFSCPEQVRGEEVAGEVVDSWAFALTVCEMACGTLPVSTTSFMQHRSLLMSDGPVPVPETGDEDLNDLLKQMLNKDLSKRLLLPVAARHPFFMGCHVIMQDTALSSTEQLLSAAYATSDGCTAAHQQQHSSLTELYERGLASVHRGKSLQDYFHGVRALRRVRRKEVETARHNSAASQTGSGGVGDSENDTTGINSDEAYGVSSGSGSDGEDEDRTQRLRIGGRPGNEKDAEVVEEVVEQQLVSQEPKLELTHITLTAPATLEKLNRLHDITTEMRLSHNALACLAPLRFSAFPLLMEIIITSNRLVEFPEEVLEAPRLVRLDLSHNRIKSIPSLLVTKAPFLERLSLHHNFIVSVGTTTIPVAAEPGATAVVSVLAAPCLRHVRLSGNPLERLPEALETTHKLQLVLDAIPALMEEWDVHMQTEDKKARSPLAATAGPRIRLPAAIVWDDSFPVRIPAVEPAVWLAANNVAMYRVQTLRVCKTRRVVLCQCADPRFPNGHFHSEELEVYFTALNKALHTRREQQRQQLATEEMPFSTSAPVKGFPCAALPAIVGKAARNYVESYFFVTEDENAEEGGYHSLVAYLYESLAANIPVLVVVVSSGTSTAVRTNIVAAISTCLTRLRGGDPDQLDAEQAEIIVSTMRSLYA
ncbi:hypothetical protein JKF63_05656 [Porcisia hertigi]|uniref:Protein kinase domain-containing protein n=1 Tax=Porcisia hertigi TaxID=2761500 RepID=A0A836IQT1_9TRYP|nr:hypothetical protein JKF63_05656 [Porcisia hertigi]